MFRSRQSALDKHPPFLDAQWTGGCRNGAELWRRLKGQGFKGSLRVVAEWARFSQSVRQANDAGKFVTNVRLDSPGGNLLEGAKIGDAIRFGKTSIAQAFQAPSLPVMVSSSCVMSKLRAINH